MLKGNPFYHFRGKLIYNLPFAQYSFLLAQYGSILPISALHKCQQMPFLCLLQQSLPISFIQKKSDLVGLSNKVALIFNFAFLMIIGFAPNHLFYDYSSSLILACAAARRAIGTRKGEQDT